MGAFEDLLADLEQARSDYEAGRQEQAAKLEALTTRAQQLENILRRGSKSLTDLFVTTVYDAVIATTGGGAQDVGAYFDVSQQSKDSIGNVVIPHAHYLLSAFTPTASRSVAYNGTIIVGTDIVVGIERITVATPTRFQSRVTIYNLGAAVNVHVQVLKLLR